MPKYIKMMEEFFKKDEKRDKKIEALFKGLEGEHKGK